MAFSWKSAKLKMLKHKRERLRIELKCGENQHAKNTEKIIELAKKDIDNGKA